MDQDAGGAGVKEEQDSRYEDAPFGIFVRFGGGRGGMWFRYKGHVRASIVEALRASLSLLVASISRVFLLQTTACYVAINAASRI